MKKTMLSIALAAIIGMAGFQVAEARQGLGPGAAAGPGYGRMAVQPDEDTLKARQQFHDETLQLRRQIVVKQTELQAVLAAQKPDEKRAASLAAELFDLRTQKHQKARELGIALPGQGLGMGQGMGPKRGSRGGV